MKTIKHRGKFVIVLSAAFFCQIAAFAAPVAEPEYNGRALSEWLVALTKGPSHEEIYAELGATPSSDTEAVERAGRKIQERNREAIRQIGTNGLPTLLDIVGIGENNRKQVLTKIKSKEIREGFRRTDMTLETLRDMAVDGFSVLGTNAEPAIPQLTKLLYEDPECRLEAAYALAQIGPKGFAVLTNAVNNEDLGGVLVLAVGQKASGDLQTITQFLITALKNPSPTTRGNAAMFLTGKDASLAIPALITVLDDDDAYPRRFAADSLGKLGPAAKSAVPKLLSVYTNTIAGTDKRLSGDTGTAMLQALKSIDREAAGRAEEFLVNSGPLNSARRGYTRTILTNGLELIAGGVIDTQIFTVTYPFLASAQLLDPKTGKWTETGKMATPREGHAAILLRDGRVFILGGHGVPSIPGRFPPVLSSAELYDPATGAWTNAGSMKFARVGPNVTLQRDGKVLISGGWNQGSISTEELFDPATGKWTVVTTYQIGL
jgi:hypothetical protein